MWLQTKIHPRFFWQFLTYDASPLIADDRSYYWEMFDDRESPLMSAFYKTYKAQDPEHAHRTSIKDIAPIYVTHGRQPGRSQKVSDKHMVDFLNMYSQNVKKNGQIARSAP